MIKVIKHINDIDTTIIYIENEFKVVINKLYLFRRTYCEECYLELKK